MNKKAYDVVIHMQLKNCLPEYAADEISIMLKEHLLDWIDNKNVTISLVEATEV